MNELKKRRNQKNQKVKINSRTEKIKDMKIEEQITFPEEENNNTNNMIFSFSSEGFQSINHPMVENNSKDSNDMLLFSLTSEQFRNLNKNQKKDSNGNLIFEDEE